MRNKFIGRMKKYKIHYIIIVCGGEREYNCINKLGKNQPEKKTSILSLLEGNNRYRSFAILIIND
jgi:hypothetical protein